MASADRDRREGWRVFGRSMAVFFSVPGLSIFGTSIGFGALAEAVDFSLIETLLAAVLVFALPAQVVFADEWARGSGIVATALAVTLTGLRLLPMTISMVPLWRPSKDGPKLGFTGLVAAHFVAITVWLESNRLLPKLPEDLRWWGYFGIAAGVCLAGVGGSLVGHSLATSVPSKVLGLLIFVTPIYFLLALLLGATQRADFVAIGCGLVIAPVVITLAPSLSLVAAGLIGGSIAYGVDRARRQGA